MSIYSPNKKTEILTCRITESLDEQLQRLADKKTYGNKSQVIRRCLYEGLKKLQ